MPMRERVVGSTSAPASRGRRKSGRSFCPAQCTSRSATSPAGGARTTNGDGLWKAGKRLGETVSEHGIEIGIEPLNRFETYFLNTAADGAAFCEAVGHPAIGLLFDTFHANIEEKRLGEALKAAAAHVKHLHTCENDRGIPGSGHVAWSELFSVTAEIGYEGWMTIESFGFSLGPLSSAAAIWRDLAPTPDAIAFEGLEVLRAGVNAARREAS